MQAKHFGLEYKLAIGILDYSKASAFRNSQPYRPYQQIYEGSALYMVVMHQVG